MLAKSIWWKGWLIWWYRIKGGSPENRSKPLEYHKKSYFRSWSFIFADYPERKFDCTLTSKFSMKLQWNLSWRGCKINFRTSRFWNCNCFLDLIMISWRNHCLENVYLTCERGITPSFVPLDLHFSVLNDWISKGLTVTRATIWRMIELNSINSNMSMKHFQINIPNYIYYKILKKNKYHTLMESKAKDFF